MAFNVGVRCLLSVWGFAFGESIIYRYSSVTQYLFAVRYIILKFVAFKHQKSVHWVLVWLFQFQLFDLLFDKANSFFVFGLLAFLKGVFQICRMILKNHMRLCVMSSSILLYSLLLNFIVFKQLLVQLVLGIRHSLHLLPGLERLHILGKVFYLLTHFQDKGIPFGVVNLR